jgi:enoyl-CoA hydratase
MRNDRTGDVEVLRLDGGKANAIDGAFLDGLDRLFARFEAGDARAAVVTGAGTSFSAGLNLVALAALGRGEMRSFLDRFHRVMARVFECPRPVVAAVNGHAIAGGCVLAMLADHRVAAAGAFRIGLNETQIGLGLPPLVTEAFRLRLPASSWNSVLLEGRLFSPEEARGVGLVDDVVTADSVVPAAVDVARRLASVPSAAYAHVKRQLRAPAVAAMESGIAALHEAWLDTWFSPATRKLHAEALAKLAAKRG